VYLFNRYFYQQTSGRWEGKQETLSDEERPAKISDRLIFESRNSATKISIGKTEPMDTEYEENNTASKAQAIQ
jgi:hypothetical protein